MPVSGWAPPYVTVDDFGRVLLFETNVKGADAWPATMFESSKNVRMMPSKSYYECWIYRKTTGSETIS